MSETKWIINMELTKLNNNKWFETDLNQIETSTDSETETQKAELNGTQTVSQSVLKFTSLNWNELNNESNL